MSIYDLLEYIYTVLKVIKMATIKTLVRSQKKDKLVSVYFRYSDYINGEKIDCKVLTGLKIHPDLWNFKDEKFRNKISNFPFGFNEKEYLLLKSNIAKLKTHILLNLNGLTKVNREIILHLIREFHNPQTKQSSINLNQYISLFISEVESGKRLTEKGTKYTSGTTKNYKEFQGQLNRYQESRKKQLDFNDITLDLYDDLLNYFWKKDHSINSIGKQIKTLKRIMGASHEEKLHNNTQYLLKRFKKISAESKSVYLSLSEIEKIYALDFTKIEDVLPTNIPQLEITRDVFLIGCFTALRYSDYCRINPSHIQETSVGYKIIKIKNKKGGNEVIIPFWHWMLDELIDKYPQGLPKTHEQKINASIKNIGRYAKIDNLENKTIYKNGVAREVVVPKYKLIMTHTARRSGATNMYKHGIPTIDIMKITGHRKESTFMRYIKQTKEETADRISEKHRINKPIIKEN